MSESRYDMKQDVNGTWAIIDRATGFITMVDGSLQVGLDRDAADGMVDLLNKLDRELMGSSKH
ncbi:hypothetical protein KHQ08_00585 (plasmid) [Pseudochrobactrum algeriensis]|uniref:hypothetical protein n=1 Tax=Pseudochrobactrum algeriensis TaxID=2834768 RepID=UPI001BCE60CC|nr:hypothetical protein [Pseudochrobactrum algeriensis]QVQ35425.1 hypothetical protein KHQ08_00585 [Pseudochrobactrum algeriensis]